MNKSTSWDAFITPHNIQHNTSKLFSPLWGICPLSYINTRLSYTIYYTTYILYDGIYLHNWNRSSYLYYIVERNRIEFSNTINFITWMTYHAMKPPPIRTEKLTNYEDILCFMYSPFDSQKVYNTNQMVVTGVGRAIL